ncbi:MAG: PilZ domain-containing protein [Treponema sp.]|nr:PilZ domain-containing protein [Treponema sp.]
MNIFFILMMIIAVPVVFSFIMSRTGNTGGGKEKKNNVLQFYAKGKDLGFSFKEIELLRRLAAKSDIEDPSALFWSQNQLDLCIRSLVRSARLSGTVQDAEIQEFLSKLYDYRKKLEFERPNTKSGLVSTRQIGESQNLRILLAGTGVFQSRLIKNMSQYITIAKPSGPNIPRNFSWTGQRVAVYFWRDGDAGYVFDADVLDEVYSKGSPALQISHSETLFRTQKRKSVRLRTHKPAFLYFRNPEDSSAIEAVPGLKCILNDISDTGCAVTIGGKGSVGLRLKIQFVLNTSPMILCGVVRSVDYNEDTNRSVLHIEADSLSVEARNEILGEIFGTQDDEEAIPFRITEENINGDEDGGGIAGIEPAVEAELQNLANDNPV